VNYVSTRGAAPVLGFDDVLLAGLARDGGLYLPEAWPAFSADEVRAFGSLTYPELAVRVMTPFMGGRAGALEDIVADAYRNFGHDEVAPLVEFAPGEWLLELFHGPTLAFKDHAMQILGPLFDRVLGDLGERITVVGATSGDTGSAAIEACRDRENIEIFILHPEGRVSEFQRRQMTTVASANVHNIAIEGTFDDCQGLLKAMFNDQAFRDRHKLAAVNSINWARIMAQVVYYFRAATLLGAPDTPVAFAVPTGNFGNVFSAYAAHRMGLPISQLIIGSNRNDILTQFFRTGRMEIGDVHPTISPSMDIQVSSNFERFLFEILDRDPDRLRALMEGFRDTGALEVSSGSLDAAQEIFSGESFDDDHTRATIKAVHKETGRLIDPHTAVGVAAGRALRRNPDEPLVFIGAAHPAKFADAVETAAGVRPQPPARFDGLMEREERCRVLANDLPRVQDFIAGRLAERQSA
jgi:threonine synthase